jgi:hypothetical protein
MKRIQNALFLFSLACLSCGANSSLAQVESAPSAEHKILKMDVGTWDCEMKMWMGADGTTDPNATPMISKGTEKNRMLGDFWLVSEFEADLGGMMFEGHATTGYDPSSKKFQGVWIDSMTPGATHMEGTYDAASKTMTSMMTKPMPDGSVQKTKSTVVYQGEDKRVMTMYELKAGTENEWLRSMEISYTRKKG